MSEKPTICVTIPSMHGAGCERMLAEVLPYYSRDFDVDLILLEHHVSYPIPSEVRVISLDAPLHGIRGMFSALRLLKKELGARQYAAVISYLDLYNAIVALSLLFRRNRPPHIACEHTTDREYFFHSRMAAWKRSFIKLALRFAYGRSDRVVAVSENLKDFLVCDLGIKTPIDVIHNAVDPQKFNMLPPHVASVDSAYLAAKRRLLCISRLDHQKNIPFLIESFRLIADRSPDATLFILGEGPERNEVESSIGDAGLTGRIVLLGFRSNPQDYLKLADVFLLASRYESFGNVVVEALACGVPVVTTDYGRVVEEIVTDTSYGRIIEQGDSAGFANAVIDILEAEGTDHTEISAAILAKFEVEEKAKRYIQTINSAITQRREEHTRH
jgi:glycosyltransferase involved in cell wall biosynthesis